MDNRDSMGGTLTSYMARNPRDTGILDNRGSDGEKKILEERRGRKEGSEDASACQA